MHGGRTRMRQELMKQQHEMERKRDEDERMRMRTIAVTQQSSIINVPTVTQTPAEEMTLEVPNDVLKVRTQLANPTSYHVTERQKQQVHQFLSQNGGQVGTRSAPVHNMVGIAFPRGAQKDPLLSRAIGTSGGSPIKPSSYNPTLVGGGSPMGHSPLNAGIASPHEFGGGGGGLFGNPPSNLNMKSESPTMMTVEQTPDDIQDQIIEDIMGLEEKFGDALGLPYLESNMMAPQTLPATSNLFDTFSGMNSISVAPGGGGGTGGPLIIPQMSASCPANVKDEGSIMVPGGMNVDVKTYEKDRQKKNNHNAIERRRRFNINDRIKELGMLLPPNETEARQNKGTILKASVDYIRKLQRESQRMRVNDVKQRQLEESNRQMRLRIQELELTARAHGIPTPSLNPETQKLADAADQALGSVTPHTKSPSSASVTPVNIFGGTDELADMLRTSPNIDFSKLQIKQEPVDSPSSNLSDNLSPSPLSANAQPYDTQPNKQQVGTVDVFSFNFTSVPSNMTPGVGMNTSTSSTTTTTSNSTNAQFFSST